MENEQLSKEVMALFSKVSLATLYSAVTRIGYDLCFMSGVKNFTSGQKVVGRAKTLSYLPTRPDIIQDRPRGVDAPEYRAMGSCGPGDVLVVGAMGNTVAAIGGDMVLLQLKMVGAEGVVTDGGIRDMDTVLSYGYRVFAGGATPASRSPYLASYSQGIDVSCGGITVRPGDLIVGDDEGVICIPKQHAEEVIDWAQEHEELEAKIKTMILEENVPPGKYYNQNTFESLAMEKREDHGFRSISSD